MYIFTLRLYTVNDVLVMTFRRWRFGDAVSAIDVLVVTVSAMDRSGDETFWR